MTITDADRSELNAHPIPQDTDLSPATEPEEAPARRQGGTVVELFLADRAEPVRVRVVNRDRIAYEKALTRHKEWPAGPAGRNFAMTFVCWSAARRAALTEATFDQWQDLLEDWDEVADAPTDPTR